MRGRRSVAFAAGGWYPWLVAWESRCSAADSAQPQLNAITVRLIVMEFKRFSCTLLALALLSGCGDEPAGPTGCVCTEEFVTISFLVIGQGGAPQSGISASVELVRTGELLDVSQPSAAVGVVSVIDDSFSSILGQGPEVLRVTGGKDSREFVAEFEVEVPEPCQCHVTKLSGPDFVMLP